MLYDLRGYHDIAAEELAAIFRNNQEPSGHVGGFANWGVYTPSMIYAVAQHYLLTADRAALDACFRKLSRARLVSRPGETGRAKRRTGAG